MTIAIPTRMSDVELVAAVNRCAHDERFGTARLVAHLAEFDARRLHLAAGYSSLFVYCLEVLGLSEHGAYNRVAAARAARRFPVILERLADGSLNVTTVRRIAKHLTGENHAELIKAASRRTKQEVQELLARLSPRPDTPASVRKVPERPPTAPMPSVSTANASTVESFERLLAPTLPPAISRPPAPRPLVTPLATDRYEIRFTASAATRDKLKLARDLLRHAVPSGDPAEIFDRALTALIDALSRKKLAIVRKPRREPRPPAESSRHIPSGVKRAVWVRDGGRCGFVAPDGHRCSERAFLEYHHVKPYTVGGEATVANIQLRCRAHNGYEADVFLGRGTGIVRESAPEYAVSWGLNSFRNELGLFDEVGANSVRNDVHRSRRLREPSGLQVECRRIRSEEPRPAAARP